ncbi:hypothetical protein SAMN05414139_08131 [Burkholderia sp. D7]|nr:hypothetical protein SAMN05414139_08131 [Burkholderia sp. D7]
MATDDNTLFTLLFDGSPAKGADAMMEGFKRCHPGAWRTLVVLQRQQIEQAVEDQVASGFNVTLGSIFSTGWNDLAKVREAIDLSITQPDDSLTVTLMSHEFEWSNKLKLVITVEGVKPFDVELELLLSMGIEAATLTIRGARIQKAEVGEFRSQAKLLCEGAQIMQWPLKSGRFPGEITFPSGIPLRRSGYGESSFGRLPA